MLLFVAIYLVSFTVYAMFWQKRESEYVRERLVEAFYDISEKNPKAEEVQFGGVIYVMKNMDSEAGKKARSNFRRLRMNELVVVGIALVAIPLGVVVSVMNGSM